MPATFATLDVMADPRDRPPGNAPGPAPDLKSTLPMTPSAPPPSAQGDSYLRTVAMSPDGGAPDEVKLARAQLEEAARVEAMMKAPRVHPAIPPKKKRNGFFIASIVLVLLAAGAAGFFLVRKAPPVKLPPSATSK